MKMKVLIRVYAAEKDTSMSGLQINDQYKPYSMS